MEPNSTNFSMDRSEDMLLLNYFIATAVADLAIQLGERDVCTPMIEAIVTYKDATKCALNSTGHHVCPLEIEKNSLYFRCICDLFGSEQICENEKLLPSFGSDDSRSLDDYIMSFAVGMVREFLNPKRIKARPLFVHKDVDGFDVHYMKTCDHKFLDALTCERVIVKMTNHIKAAATIFRRTGRFVDVTDDDEF